MAGAIAGTAILNCKLQDKLHTVALTINNVCNLSCPHCYLQYDGPNGLISAELQDHLFRSEFQHLAIVGKEPLATKLSSQLCVDLARRCHSSAKTASLITNGSRLSALAVDDARLFSWIDVSFDGGPSTYSSYRKGDYAGIIKALAHLRLNGYENINALHVLNDQTISEIDDMMQIAAAYPFQRIMFSPYIVTSNHGNNYVRPVSILTILGALAESESFRSNSSTLLVIDSAHLRNANLSFDECSDFIDHYRLSSKVLMIKEEPIKYGIVRLNYDGIALSPTDSLDPATYHANGVHLNHTPGVNLEDIFALYCERLTNPHAHSESFVLV